MAIQKYLQIALLFAVLFAVGTAAEDAKVDDKDVIVLTEANFELTVSREELMLVEFYAPWCGHCKSLAPEYAVAATTLLKNNPVIRLGKVDATVESKLAGKYGVSGYPTLFIFRNGKEEKYNGPRKADGIVAYMKKQVGPAAKPLASKEEIEKFIVSDPDSRFAVVGFFKPQQSKPSQLYSSFLITSSKTRDKYVFGRVSDPALFSEYGLTDDAIVAFKQFDEPKVVYAGSSRTSELQAWIEEQSVPLIGAYTEATSGLYSSANTPLAKFFTKSDLHDGSKSAKYYLNRIKKAAEQYKGKVVVATVKISAFESDASHYNVKDEEIALVVEHKDNKYRMDEKFSADAVAQFFQDVLDGKARKYVRSERIPTDTSKAVKTVVGLTFDEIVNDETKDVLIEFYAPWCGHCKALEPKYEELAKKVKSAKADNLVIAKIDATANDFDRKVWEVSGYPTLYFKPAKKDAKPVKYDGEREVDAMFSFLKKKSKALKAKKDEL